MTLWDINKDPTNQKRWYDEALAIAVVTPILLGFLIFQTAKRLICSTGKYITTLRQIRRTS